MDTLLIFKQFLIFFLLWFSYGSCYLLRKPFGIIKSGIQDSLNVSDNLLGYLDFAFALPYALCSLFLGFVGDKFGARKTLGCGLLGAGIATSVMGIANKYYELCVLLFISGFFQAICWPASCSILSSWFSKNNMSSIMAVYGSCIFVGSICGSFLTITLQSKSDWRNVFAVPSLIAAVIGILVLFFGRPKEPITVKEDPNLLTDNETIKTRKEISKPLTIWGVLRIPTVPEISIALSFSKGLKTAVMFWLPLYLMRVLNFNVTQSGLIPLTFEAGGLIGSVLIIVVLDKIFKCSDLLTCTGCNFLCGVAFLFLLLSAKFGVIYLHTMLFLSGALSSIVEILLCGSLPSKIGEEVNAKSSVVGVVNGIGSLGNVIEGPIIAWISSYSGIQFIIPLFVIFCFLCFLCTLKAYISYRKLQSNNSRKRRA